jgi:hypothetical protein
MRNAFCIVFLFSLAVVCVMLPVFAAENSKGNPAEKKNGKELTAENGKGHPAEKKSDKELTAELKKVMEANRDGINHNDLDLAMSSIHSQSPAFAETKKVTGQLLKDFQIKQKIVSFRFLGSDKDYAVARVILETVKVKGPEFRDNSVDSMQIFRKESGKWKVWTSAILDVKLL